MQLDRITQSVDFDTTRRSRAFLRFIVEETLAGRKKGISQHAIAERVFGRTDEFDPTIDPIVRMQAGRLRRSLKHYYLTAGAADPVTIAIPKGTYVPTFAFKGSSTGGEQRAAGQDHPRVEPWPTLLVSPFDILSDNADIAYIAQGLPSDLAAALSRYTDIQVFLSPVSAEEASGTCPARFNLSGTVATRGEDIKINVHLCDGLIGRQSWAQDFRCPMGPGLGAALDAVVQTTAATVAEEHGMMSSQLMVELKSESRPSGSAYEAILRYHHFEIEQTATRFTEALAALHQAVDNHPDCALCWSYLARLGVTHWALGMPGHAISIEASRVAALRAVTLDPSDVRCRLVLAYVHLLDDQVVQARSEAEAALRLNSDSTFYLDAVGYLLTLSGDWDRGPALIRKAVQVNPFHRKVCLAAIWLDAVRRADAPESLAAALEYAPTPNFWSPLMLAVALVAARRVDEAATEIDRLLQLQPDFPTRGHWYITRYVKPGELVCRVEEALAVAGVDLVSSPGPGQTQP